MKLKRRRGNRGARGGVAAHLSALFHFKSDTMERLMRLVVAQGETIQTQLRRLQERETQIEQYEQQMHLLRVQNLGTDYLLHSYLKDDSCEAKDEPCSEEKSNDSGVVTEELTEPPVCHRLEDDGAKVEAAVRSGSEDIEEIAAILTKIEEVNTRLLHEEEALSGMSTAVEAAHEQHKDEEELLQQELACVMHIHAQLVADARQNEQTLRETEIVLWQQRKQLEMLLLEDTESDLETKALREHLDYIIHLPPSAFRLPEDEDNLKVTSGDHTVPTAVTTISRIPPLSGCDGDSRTPSATRHTANKMSSPDGDPPPPLPSCPPPGVEEEEEDDRDSANTSSLCVSSRSSTSSETSTGSSSTSGVSTKTTSNPVSNKPSSISPSSAATSSKSGEPGGKDTDSTDSNSDTGLSSLHSSSDEGVYVLDTLV